MPLLSKSVCPPPAGTTERLWTMGIIKAWIGAVGRVRIFGWISGTGRPSWAFLGGEWMRHSPSLLEPGLFVQFVISWPYCWRFWWKQQLYLAFIGNLARFLGLVRESDFNYRLINDLVWFFKLICKWGYEIELCLFVYRSFAKPGNCLNEYHVRRSLCWTLILERRRKHF